MSYKLVIAEKPSVAQSIAKVIGADTVVMTVDENQRAVFELNFEKGEAKYGKGKGKKN